MTAGVWLNPNLVRLDKAVLCANCELISEGLNGHCASCGSESLLNLSRVLGGTIDSEMPLVILSPVQVANDSEGVVALSAAA